MTISASTIIFTLDVFATVSVAQKLLDGSPNLQAPDQMRCLATAIEELRAALPDSGGALDVAQLDHQTAPSTDDDLAPDPVVLPDDALGDVA